MTLPESTGHTPMAPEAASAFLVQCQKILSALQTSGGSGGQKKFYRVAGQTMTVCFRQSFFQQRLLPALDHLQAGGGEASQGVIHLAGPDELPEDWLHFFPEPDPQTSAEGFHAEDETGQAVVFRSDRFASFSYLSADSRHALYALSDPERLPSYETGSPLRVLFFWMLRRSGIQMMHAACVGTKRGAVLIGGHGGAGKSMTALRCLTGSMHYAGDDYTAVDLSGEFPRARSVYSSAKIHPRDLETVPGLAQWFVLPHGEDMRENKAVGFLAEGFRRQLMVAAPLKGILLPVITGEKMSRVEPLGRLQALRELAPSSLLQFPGAGQEDFQRMGELVRRLSCWRIFLGADPQSLVNAVSEVCESAGEKNNAG